MAFSDHLLRFLPAEFQYRDDLEFGDLQALLEVVTISMDEVEEAIGLFPSLLDVDTCEAQYLPYLAKMIGYPLNDRDTEDDKRRQIKNAVSWYKRKGLHEGFRILFYSLGYFANLVELWTRDYETFYRYPGTWVPPVFKATASSTKTVSTVDVTSATRNLSVSIDGSSYVSIQLPIGEDIPLATIATTIDTALEPIGGDCVVETVLKIRSRTAGESSFVSLAQVDNSAYETLGLTAKMYLGINYTVPDDWPELKENGGKWYKSPHFGIEVYSIRDYVLNPEEFDYIRERLELIRPVHTVLDFIEYIKSLSDVFEVTEDDLIASLDSNLLDQWPYAVCMDRGQFTEMEYLRDGLVPDRSETTRVAYKHIRFASNLVDRRGDFTYEYTLLYRGFEEGPPQMPDRSNPVYYREGYVEGEPKRDSCERDFEQVDITLLFNENQPFCGTLDRSGGTYFRDQPDTFYRDGSFSLLTSRDPRILDRDGEDTEYYRSGCFPPLEAEETLLFTRADLPGVYWRSLSDMTNPINLTLPDNLPYPGEGPSLEP